MLKKGCPVLLALLGCCGPLPAPAGAQTVHREREATITGPKGRTVERRLDTARGPGYVDRNLQVKRPGMTLERSVRVAGGRPMYAPPGPRPPVIVERNVFVNPRPSSSWAFGFGIAPMVTMPLWPPPPPPVIVAPAPVVVAAPGPGAVVAAAPVRSAPQPSPLDPVALAARRLQSHHAGSRREGAETLGRLGDPRAIPALVDVLKHDSSKDVKIAATRALGMIGGHEAEVVLERCIVYEKKEEVRDAAATALRDLRSRELARAPSLPPAATNSGVTSSVVPRLPVRPAPSNRPSPFSRPAPAEEPALDGPADEVGSPAPAERVPPPPPTPVNPQ